jgi:hypothetical protein
MDERDNKAMNEELQQDLTKSLADEINELIEYHESNHDYSVATETLRCILEKYAW